MSIHQQYGLTTVINAAGTFTPLGVSRSSAEVARVSAEALSEFFVMDELQDAASSVLASWTGAEAGAVTHCVSSAIVLSVAAAMTRHSADGVELLPDSKGMPDKVVIPAGHAINYGHPILQDIRLAGATPVLAGTPEFCSLDDIAHELDQPNIACLLMVSSRLVRGEPIELPQAVAQARLRGLPVIIDAAAQDMRIKELLSTNADLVLVSAHKYLASPTAGLVIGNRSLVSTVRDHEKGIGRAMKASKESICGVLAAIAERQKMDLVAWRIEQQQKVEDFIQQLKNIAGVSATAQPDPAGMPFSRVVLTIIAEKSGLNAMAIADALQAGTPSIRVMRHALDEGQIILELVPLQNEERDIIVSRLSKILLSG